MASKLCGLLAILGLSLSVSALHDSVINVDSFDGFRVYRAQPKSDEDLEKLQTLTSRPFYDFWSGVPASAASGRTVDIMVPPYKLDQIVADLADIEYTVMIPNVQNLIDVERIASAPEAGYTPKTLHAMTWTEYHPLEDMYDFLDYLETTYPDMVSTEIIGQTTEGRDMRVAKVCKGGSCGSRPAAWIDGGIHAREWISPATVTWMLRELVENNDAHPELTDEMDWYILPSANPDGYAFSRDHNRMWRKTRSDYNSIFNCRGVDANRNWGYHFNDGGSSNDKCSDTYHGPEAFSEPENVAVSNFILSIKDQLIFYNSIHSYSQLILLPWGFTSTPPDDYDTMYDLAMVGSNALSAVHGEEYETGCIPCLLYIASGSSADWAHGEAKIKFTTSMELRDTGLYGFLLPPDQIIPTAEETWAFHVAVITELLKTV